jgi:hypothetical protein
LIFLALGLAFAAVTACRQVDTPGFCCTDSAACAQHGATEPVACGAPLVCDTTTFSCVDPSNGGMCSDQNPCTSAVTPYCVSGTCKQCMGTMGCSADNPVCSPDNICGICTGDNDCTAYAADGTPHCGASGACVQCRDGNDCTDNHAPVCDMGECRACTADADCASMTCDRTSGACVAETSIIYLSPSGVGTGNCTKAAPCNTFALGVAQLGGVRTVIKAMPGDYTGQLALSGVTATIYGDGASLSPSALNQSVVVVSNGADATIQGLHVTGAGGTTNPPGIACTSGGTTSTVRLLRMRIDSNAGGGVAITGCNFALVNNFIVQNGSPSGASGGVSIATISGAGMRELSFNTIAGNTASPSVDTGVGCFQVTSPLTFDSNIVFGNQVSNGGKQVNGANCNYTYSDITDSVNGMGNITTDPGFANASGGDYHLSPTSLAIDAANPASMLGIDFDGDKRPLGAGRDIGADEAK